MVYGPILSTSCQFFSGRSVSYLIFCYIINFQSFNFLTEVGTEQNSSKFELNQYGSCLIKCSKQFNKNTVSVQLTNIIDSFQTTWNRWIIRITEYCISERTICTRMPSYVHKTFICL